MTRKVEAWTEHARLTRASKTNDVREKIVQVFKLSQANISHLLTEMTFTYQMTYHTVCQRESEIVADLISRYLYQCRIT